ncbi:uncharacterized protein LOC129766841 [Toxorhynchites rutilus septentrionalis]|uniref:uncharacterized protein LOC129766841 n=1 Tax=Toxorhynchites rutilus septentrionalis TaxID=329112 RepID=UPI002479822C|nr:uncharacterized protein LOC129766841 [Toxorhynchites rutilus septentrionalis]
MLLSAGLPLRKWASNNPAVLSDLDPEHLANSPYHELQEPQSVSTLGLVWEPTSDSMRFNVQLPLPAQILTKRKIMSYIARIFDLLGLVGPIITVAKLFMQKLWSLKTDSGDPYEWDRPLPQRLENDWRQLHSTLDSICNITVPRFVSQSRATSVQLHFFCDASEKTYGACCYVRSETTTGISIQLLTAKSKVAPLSCVQTVARLELCAAVLSSNLYKKVVSSVSLSTDAYFWTDTLTVLQWLKSSPSRWKIFVANRVSTIQTNTEVSRWRHVPGISNPADIISRDCSPTNLINCSLWWNGPSWLSLPSTHWPQTEFPAIETSNVPEEQTRVALSAITAVETQFSDALFNRFSSYTKLRRVVAYWMRYFSVLKTATLKKQREEFTFLTSIDLRDAELSLCRMAQREMFSKELLNLTSGKCIPKSSALKWLSPHVTTDGIIRVGGRLSNTRLPVDHKHPIVLLAKHPLSILLVDYYHRSLLHAGPQLMLATIRQKFWIIGGRNLVRRIYHQCHACFRNKPVLIQQTIADLPSSRVTSTRPFSVCGVDYCGPVFIKSPVRNRSPTKAYIVIFVCFSTRAVHIDLVSDLSTPAFLAVLRRFVARRGRMKEIHSDNGTAFKGAANELNRIHRMLKSDQEGRKQILDWCAENEIIWRFIPPRAPHFGGLWEAAVKSAKKHLLREIGKTSVSFEDMVTLLAQIEMCLNSRPLVPIPTDPSDLEVLTPGHFLVGTNMQAIPDINVKDVPDNRLTHWELTQKRFQQIWSRWYPEYLQQLQTRASKGCNPPIQIEVGSVVLLKDESLSPIQWPLGRITKVHPGKDGITRVVTLRTATVDAVLRPVAKIALLPLSEPYNTVVPASSSSERSG